MSECMHYFGSYCVVCQQPTNSCCGADKECFKCRSEFCYECSKKYHIEHFFTKNNIEYCCPVCNKIADDKICNENITDDQMWDYIFKIYDLDKKKIKQSIRREMIKQMVNKEYLNAIKNNSNQ